MSEPNAREHIYSPGNKDGESVAVSTSNHWATPIAIKRYQAWLRANGFTDKNVGMGKIMEENMFQNNPVLRRFFEEVVKEGTAPKSRRYMDVVKDRKRG